MEISITKRGANPQCECVASPILEPADYLIILKAIVNFIQSEESPVGVRPAAELAMLKVVVIAEEFV